MTRWFTSDTHFSHTNIVKYVDRPYKSIEEMDSSLIENWNSLVQKEDVVFFLGDFGLGNMEHLQEICSKLNGYKVCIRGNHDRSVSFMSKIGFHVVLESAFIKIGSHTVELIHIPTEQPVHFQLHGHVHEKRPNKVINNQLNLCVEVWEYKPVSEETIISLLDKASNSNQTTKQKLEDDET